MSAVKQLTHSKHKTDWPTVIKYPRLGTYNVIHLSSHPKTL